MTTRPVDNADASGGSIFGRMKTKRSTPFRLTAWLSELSKRGFTLHAHGLSSLWRAPSLNRPTLPKC